MPNCAAFGLPWINTGCFPPSSPTARYAEYLAFAPCGRETEEVERWDRVRSVAQDAQVGTDI